MPRKPRPYHIVVELIDGKWTMQFGDYDKSVATQEMSDQKDSQRLQCNSRKEWTKFKVVTVASDTQTAIDVTMCELNGETYKAAWLSEGVKPVYRLTRLWIKQPVVTIDFSDKRKAIKACNDFKDVALVSGQMLVDMSNGDILWISNGLREG